MVIPISESEVRQAMILLRREHEWDRLFSVEWPRLQGQIDQYGLQVALDGGFVRDEQELQWRPAETFETGIQKTVCWYLTHTDWVHNVQTGAYREWIKTHYESQPQ